MHTQAATRMPFLYTILCLSVVLSAVACRKTSSHDGLSDEPLAISAYGEPFTYVTPTEERMPLPSRYVAPLPSTIMELERFKHDSPEFPPFALVIDAIELGDPTWLKALAAAVDRAGSQSSELLTAYMNVLTRSPTPAHCAYVQRWVALRAPIRTAGFYLLSRCINPAYAVEFASPAAPDAAVVAWYETLYNEQLPCLARLGPALLNVVKQNPSKSVRLAAGRLLECEGGPAQLLAAYHAAQGRHKVDMAMAMFDSDEPAHKAIFQAACVTNPEEIECEIDAHGTAGIQFTQAPLPATPASLAAQIVDVAQTLAQRGAALLKLAALDRSRALQLAGQLTAKELQTSVGLRIARNLISTYRNAAAMQADLKALGLLPADAVEVNSFDLVEVLSDGGRIRRIDLLASPHHHGNLLRLIASMDPLGMHDVVFDEVVPPSMDSPSQLLAFADGHRYAVQAQSNGEEADVTSVLGLLNTVSRMRKQAMRYVLLAQRNDEEGVVMATSEAALRSLLRRGLVETAPQ
ncbi:MAG: hypothetical protein KBG15_17495 [Kofleriaceae bacterium]|nr:hypothetical protein [Kofleriaceae bacterium]